MLHNIINRWTDFLYKWNNTLSIVYNGRDQLTHQLKHSVLFIADIVAYTNGI